MSTKPTHLALQLNNSPQRVSVKTPFGTILGGRSSNGCAVFLEVPYALPPKRFQDPVPLPNAFTYPEGNQYLHETAYGAQPYNDGQAAGLPLKDKLGLGKPSENPLFLNIIAPPNFSSSSPQSHAHSHSFPVKVYIHGGFLQFGSPHALSAIATEVAAAREEVWVSIGYRLSVFGFLAGQVEVDDKTVSLSGNYGFKDQWCALQWIHANIASFGGNPNDITITGLSAGSHSVHQLLHRTACEALFQNRQSVFTHAVMQSNAILATPKKPTELWPQLLALLKALNLISTNNPSYDELVSALEEIRDPTRVSTDALVDAVEKLDDQAMGTFRGCSSIDWLPGNNAGTNEEWDQVERQANGDLARGLRAAGVKKVVMGELSEEWYLYAIAHKYPGDSESTTLSSPDAAPIKQKEWATDVVARYIPRHLAEKYVTAYEFKISPPYVNEDDRSGLHAVETLAGYALSAAQVYIPVRILEKELELAGEGVSVVRYVIDWAAEESTERVFGYKTHGTDRAIWTLSTILKPEERRISMAWLDAIEKAVKEEEKVLELSDEGMIGWQRDERGKELRRIGLL